MLSHCSFVTTQFRGLFISKSVAAAGAIGNLTYQLQQRQIEIEKLLNGQGDPLGSLVADEVEVFLLKNRYVIVRRRVGV